MTDPFLARQVEKKIRPFCPTLPDSFVPRPDQLNPLKGLLIKPSDSNTLVITSKDGLGGMGKTSLALALAKDEAVRAAFPDGILWATLGPDPDLLTPMGQWLLALDHQGMTMPTITMASTQLRHLIKRRQMLLIVDEVCSHEDLQPFKVVQDTACRLLVTTRDVSISDAQTYILGEMTASQSQQLFEAQLKQSLEHRNRKDALQFAKAVGYLPLSLHLGVSQITNGLSWSELLASLTPSADPLNREQASSDSSDSEPDIEPERPRFGRSFSSLQNLWSPGRTKAIQHQARQACLTFCLRQLSAELRLRLASLGLFPRNIDLTPRMAGTVWGLSIAESRQYLQDLKLRGFLTHGDLDAELGQSYSLHPVMRDIACWLIQLPKDSEMSGLGLSWSMGQQQFLERYRSQLQDAQWHTIPDDDYIHPHLIWHLEQAGWRGEIHQLLKAFNELGRNAWSSVCDRMGLQSCFTVDIARAWQLAKNLYEEAPEHSTGLQVRYALTSAFVRDAQYRAELPAPFGTVSADDASSSNSLIHSNAVQPKSLISEEWAFTKILLNSARYLPDLGSQLINSTLFPSTLNAQLKVQTLFELLQNVHQESTEMALELTENLLPNAASIDALIRLVPDHPSFSLSLWQALQNSSDETRLVKGIACLAQCDAHNLHQDLFPLLSKVQHPLDRLLLLESIQERLPDLLKKKAKTLKQDCLNGLSAKRKGLGQLPFTYGNILGPMDDVTEDFLALYDYSGWAIALYFEQYPSRRLDEAYSQVIRSRSEEKRSKALAFLTPRLSEQHRREIWPLTHQLIDPECKARVLSRLHPFRSEALENLLDVAKLFENQKKLKVLIASLPGPATLIEQIFATIMALSQPHARWAYFVQLLPYLSKPQYGEMVAIIYESPFDAEGSCSVLQALNPNQVEIAEGILAQVEAIPPVYERATALRTIVPYLPEKLIEKAFDIAQDIQFPYARVIALQNFISNAPELAQDAIDSLKNCHVESPDDVFDALIPVLPPEDRADAIALIATIPDEKSQLQRLIRTLPYEPDLLHEIKSLVIENPELYDHCEMQDVLGELYQVCEADLSAANPSPPRTLDLIVATLPLIDWIYSSHGAVKPSFEFCDLVQSCLAHSDPPQLEIQQVSNFLDFFYLIPREEKRAEILEQLLQSVTNPEAVTPDLWLEWLEKLSRYHPAEFHWVFSSMVTFLMSFSNNDTLNQTLQSIRSVREQWL